MWVIVVSVIVFVVIAVIVGFFLGARWVERQGGQRR